MSGPGTSASPRVFVVGCERSGTTLLQRMLDAHPELAIAYETHFLAKLARRSGGDPERPLDDALASIALEHRTFDRLGISTEDAAAARASTTVGAFVAALYEAHARAQGKRFAGEKSPHFVKVLPLLAGLLPASLCIHIVRDGRDVALSMLDWERSKEKRPGKGPWALGLWQEEPLAVCALWWASYLHSGDRGRAALGEARYWEVSYEQLIDAPQETLAALCGFLGLPDAPEMHAFHLGRGAESEGASSKDRWLPPTAGLRDWRSRMEPARLELFEALVGGVLEAHGYMRGASSIGVAARERAARCIAWWQENVSHEDMQLPEVVGQ